MTRDTILSRIRAATTLPANPAPAHHRARARLVTPGDEAIARFRANAEVKGATIIEIENLTALPAALARTIPDARTIRMNDPVFREMPWSDAGVTPLFGAATPDDTVALSRALAAVAETGTLVLASSAENPPSFAFLPEVHIVLISRSEIVGAFEDALGILHHRFRTNFPRSVNFISGASRTGDIGGRIVHGAHGPRRLIVAIC